MSNHESIFEGPIFVVGMPRSGTKLLRTLLKNHSAISIPSRESNVLPYFHQKFKTYGNIEDITNFTRFYNDFSQTSFFRNMSSKRGFHIEKHEWHKLIKNWDFPGAIEAYYRHFMEFENRRIWGDKSPGYHKHIQLLKGMFPSARFIHIIRDVRDYCISINKAWNKNIYRASQRWVDDIQLARNQAKSIDPSCYLEVRYEDLLKDTSTVLHSMCAFLQIPYEENMQNLIKPSENLGETKGQAKVVSTNYDKWKKYYSQKQLQKIERIAYVLLEDLGYETVTDGSNIGRVSKFKMTIYRIWDFVNYSISEVKLKGFQELRTIFKSLKFKI